VAERSLDDAQLIRYMYTHSSVTVPHIAKVFNVDPKTASYHLEKLVKLGLMVKKEKKYGSRYMLKPELTRIPTRFYIQTALTYTPLIFGIILFLQSHYLVSSIFLVLSSIFGTLSAFQQISHLKKLRLEEILALLKK